MNPKVKQLTDVLLQQTIKQAKGRLGKQMDASYAYLKKTAPILISLSACIYLQKNFRKGVKTGDIHE